MSDDDTLVNFRAPEETVETAKMKLEHGEMSKELRTRLEEIAHGTDVAERTRIKDQLKEKRQERRDKQREINNLQNDVDEIDRDIERLEERLDQLAEQEGEYDGYLKSLEADLRDGEHLFAGHAKVEEAATLGDCSEEEVINRLQERNPEIPDLQFKPANQF